jgi:hypothetical protein
VNFEVERRPRNVEKDKVYYRTKVLFTTRFIVFLDKYKKDTVAELLAESLKEAVEIVYNDGRFGGLQRTERQIVLDRIVKKVSTLLEI